MQNQGIHGAVRRQPIPLEARSLRTVPGMWTGVRQRCRRGPSAACRAAATAESELLPWQKVGGSVNIRSDIKTVMIIGAGPIVIGQACEFDYSGTQACKALKAEGYRVVLLNSNPATIMTDPETADRTYIGPMSPDLVEQILIKEKPDAILPTMGGQTGLNIAKGLAESGILDKHGIELIGAKLPSIDRAEDRDLFKQAMEKLGLDMAISKTAETVEEARVIARDLIGGFPIIVRPAYTLGGTGGGIAYNQNEFETIVAAGLDASMTSQVLVEQSLLGWKEYELEVMRDLADNVVIICSIENVDPMGVHTGDSITVAPQQTLTDKEYQRLRDASVAIIREMGVECGGSNVQLATDPETGKMVVIEMNPRVSRSSALASKATGFPIAKMATKLAMGFTLDQIPNDITLKTPASFEPSIDYVITKMPRFAFEKFPGSEARLTTMMKSVGETMAMGRTWIESLQKACRGLEIGLDGWGLPKDYKLLPKDQLVFKLRTPNPERIVVLKQAFNEGMSKKEMFEYTNIDPWWLDHLQVLHDTELWLREQKIDNLTADDWREVKSRGFSDSQLARFMGAKWLEVRNARKAAGVVPTYKRVDTCAAEFAAQTPYLYSCYDDENESYATENPKVLILGGGPNRIGQGIEFDYCCCHASFSLRDAGYETIMMNSNPETVSTDYDTSSRLYFEPLTVEDVLNVIEVEKPEGIIVQFGGQTPLKLATGLQEYLDANPIPAASGRGNVSIWGTSPDAIDESEDRDRWMALLNKLDIRQPQGGSARSYEEAFKAAQNLGYPCMVRPSYVLGGRAMEIVYNDEQLDRYLTHAVVASEDKPVLVDKYLAGATELDVDALCDKDGNVVICGIMEHIEEAGVHSGDSACSLPPQTIDEETLAQMRDWTTRIAKQLKVIGLINVQYCIKGGDLYIIEANPRASRTVPFVAKAVGHPIAAYASLLMSGKTLSDINFTEQPHVDHVAVKEVVLPFSKFPGADLLLGPEMRSTGEVMGIDMTFDLAYAKASLAAGQKLPAPGTGVFVSVRDEDKASIGPVVRGLSELGYKLFATSGTADAIRKTGCEVQQIFKINEGRPNANDALLNGDVKMMIITSAGDEPDVRDGRDLRRKALELSVPLVTTVSGGAATVGALKVLKEGSIEQVPLQDYFKVLPSSGNKIAPQAAAAAGAAA